jgi:hypothetical protein
VVEILKVAAGEQERQSGWQSQRQSEPHSVSPSRREIRTPAGSSSHSF